MIKNKNMIIYNIIAFLVILGADILYSIVGMPYIFKTFASVLFVVSGIINFVVAYKCGFYNQKRRSFAMLMLIGLIFAMAGDIVLIDFFEFGAGLFAVGHIFFFVAYLMLSKFSVRDLLCAVCIFVPALLLILFYDGFTFNGIMFPVVLIYALIISLMLGKSISNLFDKDMLKVAKWLIFVGSLMFFLSDVCLLFNVFAGVGRWIDLLCIFLYYPAEAILASTIYFATKEMK